MPLVNGTGNGPSPGRPTPAVVKQDKSSGGSVDTTKTRSDPQRVRMSGGERPIGAAKGTQSDTEALYHPPPPDLTEFGRTSLCPCVAQMDGAIPKTGPCHVECGKSDRLKPRAMGWLARYECPIDLLNKGNARIHARRVAGVK